MKIKENFLPIPDAPNYEVNSQFLVRNKKTGRILKFLTRQNTKTPAVSFIDSKGKHKIVSVKTLRRQALIAIKINTWEPIPSLDNKYEFKSNGACRNAKTKQLLKLINRNFFCGYAFSLNGKVVKRTLKNLRWEVFGDTYKMPHCTPIPCKVIFEVDKRKFFNNLSDCARFISQQTHRFYCNVRYALKRRVTEIDGYKITYYPPKDLAEVTDTVTQWKGKRYGEKGK